MVYFQPMREKSESPFESVVEIAGGRAALAEACGVTVQAVGKWQRRIPSERVIQLEKLVNGKVSRHEMRPDLYPEDRA